MITKGIGIVFISVSVLAAGTTAWFLIMFQKVVPEIVSLIIIPAIVGFALLRMSKRKETSLQK
jgi:hypothetical protein